MPSKDENFLFPGQAGTVEGVFAVLDEFGYEGWARIEGMPYCNGARIPGNRVAPLFGLGAAINCTFKICRIKSADYGR